MAASKSRKAAMQKYIKKAMAKQVEKGNLERVDAAKQVSRALGSNDDIN